MTKEKAKAYSKKYREDNREKLLLQKKEYYWANREESLRKAKNWKEENKEYASAKAKADYRANPEKAKARAMRRRAEQPLVVALEKKNWKGRTRAGVDVTDITTEWLLILWNKTSVCEVCGDLLSSDPSKKQLDHIIPIQNGGEHTKKNVRFICSKCNCSMNQRMKSGI